MFLRDSLVRDGSGMPSLILLIQGRPVIPWTVVSISESISFAQMFEKLRAGAIGTLEKYAGSLQQCQLTQCGIAKDHSRLLTGYYYLMKCVCILDHM